MSSDVKMETLVSEGKRKLLYSGTHVAKKRVRKASVSLASTTLPKPQFPGGILLLSINYIQSRDYIKYIDYIKDIE